MKKSCGFRDRGPAQDLGVPEASPPTTRPPSRPRAARCCSSPASVRSAVTPRRPFLEGLERQPRACARLDHVDVPCTPFFQGTDLAPAVCRP